MYFSLSASLKAGLASDQNRTRITFPSVGQQAVDIRGTGGMIICPPSAGFDKGGQPSKYVWEEKFTRTALMAMPQWLVLAVNASSSSLARPLRGLPDPATNMHPVEVKGRTWHESQSLIHELQALLHRGVGDSLSVYCNSVQLRTCVSHNFRTQGRRSCVYGQEHVSNHF